MKKSQVEKLNNLLKIAFEKSDFYRKKLKKAGFKKPPQIKSRKDLADLPFTTKEELKRVQKGGFPFEENLTEPASKYFYTTFTSGTTGKQLYIPYTKEDFARALDIETEWIKLAGVAKKDKVYFMLPYSLYPFLFLASKKIGAMEVPNDARSDWEHLEAMKRLGVTIVETSPTNVFNLMEAASEENIDLKKLALKEIILTGERAASIASVRKEIEESWNTKCYDAIGSAELLVYTYTCKKGGVHLMEHTVFEVVDPETGEEASEGELVATPLWRTGFPLIRYKTGDKVKPGRSCSCGDKALRIEGGLLGRVDGAIRLRERSYFASELEKLIHNFVKEGKYLIEARKENGVDEVSIFLEMPISVKRNLAERVKKRFQSYLGFSPRVFVVPPKSLPRYQWKGERVADLREEGERFEISFFQHLVDIGYKIGAKMASLQQA